MTGLESTLGHYPHLIAAIEAAATLAAVITSLVIALAASRAARTQLRASANLIFILHDSIPRATAPRYVAVWITNTGVMALRLPFAFFYWGLPFQRAGWQVNPIDFYADDEWVAQRTYPIEVAPRASTTIYLATEKMLVDAVEKIKADLGPSRAWRLGFLRATVLTDDGRLFRVSLSKELRALVEEGRYRSVPP